jgi:hypothetical protein
MVMTRKDFRALADCLYALKRDLDKASADGCDNLINIAFVEHVKRIGEFCARRNENFNFSKFRDAANGE